MYKVKGSNEKRFDNSVVIEGWIYDASKLEKKISNSEKNKGVEYIGGRLDIATDDNLTNIVTVEYTFETPVFKSGKTNRNWDVLSKIIDGTYKSVLGAGGDKSQATCVKITSAIGLNEYYSDKSGEVKLVSYKINNGGFIGVISEARLNPEQSKRASFLEDMIITNVAVKEANEERGLPEKAIVSGYILDFRKSLLPTSFETTNPGAINYFVGLDASQKNPIFTQIKGVQINESVKRTITQKGAFGDEVREVESSNRAWSITWAADEPYEFDSPETITIAEIQEGLANRQIVEANLKANYETRKNSGGAGAFNTAAVTTTPFNF